MESLTTEELELKLSEYHVVFKKAVDELSALGYPIGPDDVVFVGNYGNIRSRIREVEYILHYRYNLVVYSYFLYKAFRL